MEEQTLLDSILAGESRPVVLDARGEPVDLPPALAELFVGIAQAMKRKQAVFLMHEDEAFTTQASANFLGMSRQHLVRLLEAGELPFHFVGTHRKVFFKDLVAFRQARIANRREGLRQMTRDMVAEDCYD
jgi:excisionase family DNA binding protein